MKLKLIALGGILSISSIGFAMEYETVQMPDAQTLQARLYKNGFQNFADKTNIVMEFANQEKLLLTFSNEICAFIHNYNQSVKKDMPPEKAILLTGHLNDFKRYLFEALFEDEQKALEKLKKLGIC